MSDIHLNVGERIPIPFAFSKEDAAQESFRTRRKEGKPAKSGGDGGDHIGTCSMTFQQSRHARDRTGGKKRKGTCRVTKGGPWWGIILRLFVSIRFARRGKGHRYLIGRGVCEKRIMLDGCATLTDRDIAESTRTNFFMGWRRRKRRTKRPIRPGGDQHSFSLDRLGPQRRKNKKQLWKKKLVVVSIAGRKGERRPRSC